MLDELNRVKLSLALLFFLPRESLDGIWRFLVSFFIPELFFFAFFGLDGFLFLLFVLLDLFFFVLSLLDGRFLLL